MFEMYVRNSRFRMFCTTQADQQLSHWLEICLLCCCSRWFTWFCSLCSRLGYFPGEKPFECKLCHQRSRDYSAMIKHLRTHNGASPYQCTICQDFCPSLAGMQKHMKGHKPEDVPPDWRIEKTYLYICYV